MNSSLLAAYTVIALLVALYTIIRMAIAGPQFRIDHDPLDRGILLLTALVASAAWGILLPLYASGWLSSRTGRGTLARLRTLPRLRPEPLFRDRLHRASR